MMQKKSNNALLRRAIGAGLMLWVGGSIVVPSAIAQGASREQLDDYLGRLVTEIRASVPDLSIYEPFLVLHVLHDERGYRVQASDLLERRFTTALAEQRVRVIDQQARQLILEELEDCYTEDAPFCRASDVVGRFQAAGGILEGSVLPVRGGTEFRAKLVVATGNAELSPGEILGTWSVVIPPPSLDPIDDLLPAAGAVSYGAFRSDTLGPEALGELRIDVRTQDGTPAWVNIDGQINVPAPATTTMAAGRHLVTVTASGHEPFAGYIEVVPRGIVQREIVLARGEGEIWVRSNALEAYVALDGQRVGTTPWRGKKIETGPHTIRIERDGYQPYQLEFVLEHEQLKDVYAELMELPGDIVITCMQDDIAVFMDDVANGPVGTCSTGRTLTLKDVPAGRHTLWGARGSDRSNRVNVVVRGAQAVPLSLSLRLDLPDDVRDANERASSEQELFEPFGGRRWPPGLYIDVGPLVGLADWQISAPDTSGSFETWGMGFRAEFDLYARGWKLSLGFDVLFLNDFDAFTGNNRYSEIYLSIFRYFRLSSSVQPFIGVRGGLNSIALDSPDVYQAKLSGTGVSIGADGGLSIRLGNTTALALGVTYSYTGSAYLIEESSGIDDFVDQIDVTDWQVASGYALLRVLVGSRE
jgi:hypothetical protein